MRSFSNVVLAIGAMGLGLLAGSAQGSVLLFETAAGGALVSGDLPTYGDNVTAVTQGGHKYALTEGATPNVTASYLNTIPYGPGGYGDLSNILYRYKSPITAADFMELKLTADAGYKVRLHSFQFGAYGAAVRTLDILEVRDESNAVLYSESPNTVPATGHDSNVFGTPLVGQSLTIRFSESGSNNYNNGLDNVVFSQVVVPEPASALLFGSVCYLATTNSRRRCR